MMERYMQNCECISALPVKLLLLLKQEANLLEVRYKIMVKSRATPNGKKCQERFFFFSD